MTRIPIKRALISVYDKAGLADLARALHEAGAEIVSTGTTAADLEKAGIPVTRVEELTGFPECLDGRVKTLHPRVHAGLLADMANPDHDQQLADLDIEPFQLLVVQPVPVRADGRLGRRPTARSSSRSTSAAPRWSAPRPRTTAASPSSPARPSTATCPRRWRTAGSRWSERRRLAAAAYAHTAAYDAAVASWFAASYAPDEVAQETGWPALSPPVLVAGRRAPLRREPAPEGGPLHQSPHRSERIRDRTPASPHAGRAARQGDVLQQLCRRRLRPPGRLRLRRALRRDHQALQPVRHRDRHRHRRRARQGARLRPAVAPTAAWSRPTAP